MSSSPQVSFARLPTPPRGSETALLANLGSFSRQNHPSTPESFGSSSLPSFGRSFEVIEGKKWFYRLVRKEGFRGRCLLDEHPISSLENSLVVCLVVPTSSLWRKNETQSEKRKPTTRLYSAFSSYTEFYGYQNLFADTRRSFFEIILGEFSQKPHFDIDIDLSKLSVDLLNGKSGEEFADSVREALIDAILVTLNRHNVTIKVEQDILLYTSHGRDKRSYHVLVGNFAHPNNGEAKAFYQEVTSNMPKELSVFVDAAVYSPRQQFRLLWSQKLDSMRPKIFHRHWTYKGETIIHEYIEDPDNENHERLIQLEESLVSQTANCTILPPIGVENPDDGSFGSSSRDLSDEPDLDRSLAKEAFGAALRYSRGLGIDFPYTISGIKGNLLTLKRTRASHCMICGRVHEHENPFLTVGLIWDESIRSRTVYFHCRRADQRGRLSVGSIVDNITQDTPTQPERSDRGDEEKVTMSNLPIRKEAERNIVGLFFQNTIAERLNTLAMKDTSSLYPKRKKREIHEESLHLIMERVLANK